MTQIYLHKSKANSLAFAVPSKDMKKEHMVDYFFSVVLLTKFKKYAAINAFSGISIKNIDVIRVILIYLSVSSDGFLKNKIKDSNGLIKYCISILFFVLFLQGGQVLGQIGYLNYPTTTHVETWNTNLQEISTNRQLGANATIGCLPNNSIVYSGSMNMAGFALNIAGTSTSLGEINGGGKVIFTGNSTNVASLGTIFQGATLQMGLNTSALTGKIPNPFTINGTLNLFGAYTSSTNLIGAGNTVSATGVVNIEGPGTCGTGRINFASNGIAAGATINIKNAITVYPNNNTIGGTVNLLEGSSFSSSDLVYSGTIYLNAGTAWKDANCVEQYNIMEESPKTFAGKVNVGPNGGSVGSTTSTGSIQFNATLSGSGPLRINKPGVTTTVILNGNGTNYTGDVSIWGGQIQPMGNALVNSQVRLGDAASFLPSGSTVLIKSLQSVSTADLNARLFVSLVGITISNQDPEPFYGTFASASTTSQTIIQSGNFQIASTTGAATNPLYIQGTARVGGYGGTAKYGTAGPPCNQLS